jgi:cell division septum initiation protein DivIVA
LLDNAAHAEVPERAEARLESLPAVRDIPELPPELDEPELPGALFGYDKYSVTKLLNNLREFFLDLSGAAAERDEQIRHLALELHRNREGQRLIAETLLQAQQHAQSIREEARRNAAALLKGARKQAEKLQEEIERAARTRAEELIASVEHERAQLIEAAEQERAQLIEAAEQERAKVLAQAAEAKAFVEQTHEQLSDFLMAAVRWYEKAGLSGNEPQPETPPSAQGVPERPQLDAFGSNGSADARIAKDT